MTSRSLRETADSEPFPQLSSRLHLALVAAIVGLAFLVRVVPVLRGGGMYGIIDYDDSVYFGSALALVHGRIPYHDFLLLHPPGILYVLAPVAWLGTVLGDATAFASARLAFMVLGAANAGLVALVAGPLGRRAALSAAGLYAVWQVAANVERTTWLIAPQNTLLLLAMLVVARSESRRSVTIRESAALGALLGLSFSIQLWGVVPLAAVLACLILRSRSQTGAWRRPALAYLVAAGVSAAIVWLPFLFTAGPQVVRYTVIDQLSRPPLQGSLVTRLRAMEGLPISGSGVLSRAVPDVLVVVSFVVVAACIAWAAWHRPAIRSWVIVLGAQAAVLLVLPPFAHYAGWLAPTGALAIGGTAATVMERPRWVARRSIGLAAAYGLGLAILLAVAFVHRVGTHLDATRLSALLADAHCVTADAPVLLIETGTLSRDLQRGCPLLLDPSGTSYDTDRGLPRSRSRQPEYQKAMEAYYGASDAALFMRLPDDSLSAETWDSIRGRLPINARVGPVTVQLRVSP